MLSEALKHLWHFSSGTAPKSIRDLFSFAQNDIMML